MTHCFKFYSLAEIVNQSFLANWLKQLQTETAWLKHLAIPKLTAWLELNSKFSYAKPGPRPGYCQSFLLSSRGICSKYVKFTES